MQDAVPNIRPRLVDEDARAQIARERREHQERTGREIDDLAVEYHARLPRHESQGTGAIYARYSSKFQDSITDQVRSVFEAAVARRIFIPREFVFFDSAIRGYKERRPGLDQLRLVLARKGVDVLLVFATSRLFRKTYKALQFVEEEVVERGIRCMFVTSGVDTADGDRWRMLLNLNSFTDEAVVGMHAGHVRAAQQGLFGHGLVHGSMPFGYRGRDVPGRMTKRQRPRQAYEIDPASAPWVEQAFRWFVDDRLSLGEIARRFNDEPRIPPNTRSITGQWSPRLIRYMLANARYRGWWEYGATENVWQSKKDYSLQVRRDAPLEAAQYEHLRILDDETWHRAQRLLSEGNRSAAGRKPRDGGRRQRPRLLNGLFVCPEHHQTLYVGGAHGASMFCKTCRARPSGGRSLYSQLNRSLALRLTCQALAELIRRDEALGRSVVEACRREAAAMQEPDPAELQRLKARHEKLTGRIQFVMGDVGDTELDRREARASLGQSRRERAAVAAEIRALEGPRGRTVTVPGEGEVRDLLAQFGGILAAAARAGGEAETAKAREIVDLLTGGTIELVQRGERKAKRGWLQGRFRPRLVTGLVRELTGTNPAEDMEAPVMTIDYREPTPCEAWSDRVKELIDRGKLLKEIAEELGITRNLAAKALARWYEGRGMAKPDGRARLASLGREPLEPPRHVLITDTVMRMYGEGLLLHEIASRVGCDRATVAKAIANWHRLRGLATPDGRTRRKELGRQSSSSAARDVPGPDPTRPA
jgi:site-specific DNA recombinase